jgi:response regulator RpfG family c-di-GMP phosphodiesterase
VEGNRGKMQQHTILAVDDEPANLRMIERLFRKDYRVLTAACGEDALKILNVEDVSLIITDQHMPGKNGADSVRTIMTGFTDIESLVNAINTSHVFRFVGKPWDPVQLKQIVRDALSDYEKQLNHKRLISDLVAFVQTHPSLFVTDTETEGAGESVNKAS